MLIFLIFAAIIVVTTASPTFFTLNMKTDYMTAKRKCQDLDGEIAQILNSDDQKAASKVLKGATKNFWIGLESDPNSWYSWVEATIKTLTYTNWGIGSPVTAGHNCVSMGTEDHTWHVSDCDSSFDALCIETNKYFIARPTSGNINYDEGKELCETEGGSIAIILNEKDQIYVNELVGNDNNQEFWIGLTDRFTEGDFVWHDGSSLSYTNWYSGSDFMEPNHATSYEDCVEVNHFRQVKWADRGCNAGLHGVICQPAYKNKYFIAKLTSGSINYDAGKQLCETNNGSIAIIANEKDQNNVNQLVGKDNIQVFWIGLTDRFQEGNFVWHDGSSLSYTNWYSGEPNDKNGTADCVEVNHFRKIKWIDQNCIYRLPAVICEI